MLAGVFLATTCYAQKLVAECGPGIGNCPSNKPCCSQYGQCGVGAFCLGGCDPKHSQSIDSCVPAPVCRSQKYTFEDLTKVADKTKYLGDASHFDWVADGKPALSGSDLLLTMSPGTVGTVLASTTYVWYGNIKAKVKTSRGPGVVSSFILMSDMKDEVDYEWIGSDLDQTQTNYYFQGIPNYTHSEKFETKSTFDVWHDYEIDWTPDRISWSIDGNEVRVLEKSNTFNSTTKNYDYPQTPSRIQLSLWPGGLATNDPYTIKWAGGEIDWNSQDIKNPGYFYMMFRSVEVQCYDPPKGAKIQGSKSYIYDNAAGYETNVVITDKNYVLKSLLATGENMDKDLPKDMSNYNSSDNMIGDVETVPGHIGSGTGASSLQSSSGTYSNDVQDQGITANAKKTGEFSQGTTPTGDAANTRIVQGSMLAIVVAIAAIMVL